MTNQNVVVSDTKSGLGMAITVALSNSLFSPASVDSEYITISKKMLVKRLESGARLSAWIDFMRASSPTRKSHASLTSENEDKTKTEWIIHYPSALGMFEEIISLSKGKDIVVFLDYDGTLSPIVEDPDRAFMTNEMREAVREVSKYFPTAIVTGRCRAKVYDFVKLSQLYYAGSHGMDIKGPAKSNKYLKGNQRVMCQPAREFLPMINEVYKALLEKTKSTPGAMVENNKYCVSVHFRCVDEKRWNSLAEQVKLVLNEYPKLKLSQGRKVLEIRPAIKWDKGKALEFLLETLGYANSNNVFPIYIGDDRTDEDAFKVLRKRKQGFGVLVSDVPKETNASYSLQEPSEVMHFLRRLGEWRQNRIN